LDVLINDKVICESKAEYTTAAPAHGHTKRDGPHDASDGKPHIRKMTACTGMGPMKKGDKVRIEANYDYTKFPGMKATEIMGISIMYAAMDI
jgi:hypothetical protein